jgi:hypothetical protein
MTAEWQASTTVKRAAKDLKPSPELPLYLLKDKKPLLVVRARLRLGVALVPHRKHVYNKAESKHCAHCIHPIGTVEHVLMLCPQFMTARCILVDALQSLDPPVALTPNLLLGCPPAEGVNLPKKHRLLLHEQCLQTTGDFLVLLDRTLHL